MKSVVGRTVKLSCSGLFWLVCMCLAAMQSYGDSCLPAIPDWQMVGSMGDLVAYSLSSAGDVNGDGYADFLIGSPGTRAYTGKVTLYYGNRNGVSTDSVWSVRGTELYEQVGTTVCGVGDVNNDGYDDFVTGADGAGVGQGRISLYSGSESEPILMWSELGRNLGLAGLGVLGYEVSAAGDVNGDGYDDFLACDYYQWFDRGYIYLYFGGMSGVVQTQVVYDAGGSAFGHAVSAGDINGDGYSDVIAGARSGKDRVYIFYGSSNGLEETPSVTLKEKQKKKKDAMYGDAVCSGGDVNGDGYDDVLVGAYNDNYGRGKVYLYLGGPEGIDTEAVWSQAGITASGDFGCSVSIAGDVNADGYDDILIGACAEDRAYLYLGASNGVVSELNWDYTGPDDSFYGGNVCFAGDINGDRAVDVVIGGYAYSGYAGEADVFLSLCGSVMDEPIVWSGGAGAADMLFSTCSNWLERCPEENDELFFPDTGSLYPTNDMTGITWKGIHFSNTVSYTMCGESLRLSEYIRLTGDAPVLFRDGVSFAGNEISLFCHVSTMRMEQVTFEPGTHFTAGGNGVIEWSQVDAVGASLTLTSGVYFAQKEGPVFSQVQVGADATFAGHGQVASLALSGQLSTVFDGVPGVMTASTVAVYGGATLRHVVSSRENDLLKVNGAIALYGAVNVMLSSDGSGSAYQEHVLIDYSSGVVGFMPEWNLMTDIPGLDISSAVVTNDAVNRVIKITGLRPQHVELTNAVVNTGDENVALYVDAASGQTYDLITIDTRKYSDSLSNAWQKAEELQAVSDHVVFSNSVDNLQPSELRLYRVAPSGSWEPGAANRVASPEVFIAQKIRMYPGRNWVSFAGVPSSLRIGDVFPDGLPYGSSAASSACVYLYDLAQSANPTGSLWFNGAHWQYKDTDENADDFQLPLLQGLVVSLPPGKTTDVTVVTSLRTNAQTRTIAGQGRETFVSINLPGYMHPAEMNLIESGFSGSYRLTKSDQICKWDRENQCIAGNIWYWYDTSSGLWKTSDRRTLSQDEKPFSPDDAIIIKTSDRNSGFVWELPVYYTPPTAEMTP